MSIIYELNEKTALRGFSIFAVVRLHGFFTGLCQPCRYIVTDFVIVFVKVNGDESRSIIATMKIGVVYPTFTVFIV